MILSQFISQAYLKATGKPTAPTSGTKKYNQLNALGAFYTEAWQNEPGIDWSSLYDFFASGTVTATDTFALDADIRKVSQQEGDTVKILHTDNNESYYELVSPERLQEHRYNNAVAVIGRNLVFSSAFEADDPQIGGTIVVPGYGYATFPTTDATPIPVDIPEWLVTVCAAEYVRTDQTRQNQYPNLIAEANVYMEKMKENNGRRIDEIYRPNFFLNTKDWLSYD